ncbi:N-acetylglucosamine-6-phosphate deacetylase [Rarobacter faecitabidus]|uniref:N-acetylglucosamine 6-phosphate deacetylase n=1 Tax=Rarobacter faecitabidus TaxID=13243 RepID=A0A542ZX01_RARFA|nr:N-acetylglucosamine-6-phosphate deacetylase [Rarobacter faecitabidus]TQL64878.1 N-acetylglucosamine 6-phosphate deacetylase [Rarobacter faecitabidus]
MSSPRTIIRAARIVGSDAIYEPGWIVSEGGLVLEIGTGDPPAADAELLDLPGATLVPGFVDIHTHGGGGGTYAGSDRDSAVLARSAHLTNGTTTTMASQVTQSPAELLAGVRMLADLAREGVIRGIHLEGPWISPAKKGAHPLQFLRDPDAREIDALLTAGDGAIRMVTLAPELPGAIAAIGRFVEAGVRVAIGHTDADYDTTRRAIDAGATVATHLFNAMRPLGHREPGPILALLSDPRVVVELIADGVHTHPDLVAWVRRIAAPGRVAYVTDAMSAACIDDGDYLLGALDVEVRGGVARIAGTGTIAGSTTTMADSFRAALRAEPGAATENELLAAVRVTATTPAAAMGWEDVGDLFPGKRTDAVALEPSGQVRTVLLGGTVVE